MFHINWDRMFSRPAPGVWRMANGESLSDRTLGSLLLMVVAHRFEYLEELLIVADRLEEIGSNFHQVVRTAVRKRYAALREFSDFHWTQRKSRKPPTCTRCGGSGIVASMDDDSDARECPRCSW